MKKLIIAIVVIALTPLYLIIKLMGSMFEFITYLVEPICEGVSTFFDNMCNFWRKVLKIKED